jgi:hypothetical protein
MDLLTTVRKEGSRGGTGDFKWSDVQSSTRRENYLGHSLMAPVGRWQKGKVLDWYAKGDTENKEGETDTQRAARERKEEIRLVKEAEQDALARALGFEVAPRNPNMEALGDKREVDRVLKEAVEDESGSGGKGVGFGALGAAGPKPQFGDDERIEGNAEGQDAELGKALRGYRRRHGDDAELPKKKGKDTERRHHKHHRHHSRDMNRDQKHRRRSRSREHHRSKRDRSRSRSRSTGRDQRPREGKADRAATRIDNERNRSRSPRRRREDRDDRYRREDHDRRRNHLD